MIPATVIRPPWPDELARLFEAFPNITAPGPTDYLVLATTAPNERLVGVAALGRRPEPAPTDTAAPAPLRWVVRPRFEAESPRLLQAALEHARRAGLPALQCETIGEEGDADQRRLAEAGFVCGRTEELWCIPLAAYATRLAPLAAGLVRRAAAAGLAAGPARPAHDEQLIALVGTAGLLPAARVRFSDTTPGGYDRELSSVVAHAGRVVAALLIRQDPPRAIVETRVTTPAFIGKSNLPNALLLQRSLGQAQAAGLTEVVLTANPATADETIRMARRLGGTLLRRHRLWIAKTARPL